MPQRKLVRSKKAAKAKKTTKSTKAAKPTKKTKPVKSNKPIKPSGKRTDGLTPRQREILKLVSQGNTNRDIARRLAISVRTVEVHRFNLMRRLKVRNVAQLLRQALQQGFLPKNFAFK
jgi:DNA-binding NarL/FixJ family response regulator